MEDRDIRQTGREYRDGEMEDRDKRQTGRESTVMERARTETDQQIYRESEYRDKEREDRD